MNADALFNDGLRRARAGDSIAALALLRQAVAVEGDRAESYRLMGKAHLHLGELEAAQRCWRQALALEPGDTGSAACLAALVRFQRTRQAAATVAVVAVLAVVAGSLWYQWSSLRGIQEAVRSLEVSLRLARETQKSATPQPLPPAPPYPSVTSPGKAASSPVASVEIRYREALSAAMSGDLQKARLLFERMALEIPAQEPLAGNIHFWLGRCLYELGEIRQALDQFNIVLERFPRNPKLGDALLDAGRCHVRLGQRDQARLPWQRLLDGVFDPKLQEAARRRMGEEWPSR